ncbi:16S rRNA (cytosine(1402)-N(4))-methyltransferase RsmH [Candidatus Mycolicibacterium alkanivorans]|uniref:Ribosomal RNA small subunit methyltransferase H n=1 Tax=Candidatus Mycolicibacterium alkanivorans TaxID=2954114 RepID=A0ABS9YW41_9MYCO|nr:16S rRNA (cytosine(1402)-N(4))-methyltransferase RsmH [Candidatus Mycolicibacterium alkanivorans]MCI4675420.1 16S rRNA (cytosine(1402)-N(4))-methyltransferase RsmH [Candidatus Mycolicibacterium alkanivorans]
MKRSATSSDPARAPWPLPEPTLAYFPNARFATPGRDLGAGTPADRPGGSVVVDSADHGHVPVLLQRCVDLLAPALTRRAADGSGAVLVDATLGAGGHAERFLGDFPGLRLIGLDRDPNALAGATQRLAPFADRITLVRTRYDGLADALAEAGCATTASVDGVLFDLGVSSMQLDQRERGFSYAQDAPLDMRMDPEAPLTAAEILNTYDRAALTDILRRFGEEKFAHRIAGLVVERREREPLTTTGELVEIIYKAVPAPARRTGGHPAKRTFQALRIAVNAELDSLSAALPAALSALRPGGRIVVMAYQSLEDRIVKTTFAAATASRTPAGLPVELPGHEPEFIAITRGAERAGADEIERNPRSAPVRLRAVQRAELGNPGRGGDN